MFAKRYKAEELIDIIAAPSYNPELLQYIDRTKNGPSLGQFLSAKPRLGVTGTIAKDYVSSETSDAIPYFTTKQVGKSLYADTSNCKYISKEADIEWAHCRVPNDTIIINKSGRVGAAAIINSGNYEYVNSVSDIINIRLNENTKLDKGFLVVYLNNIYGQSQLIRLCGGAIFDHVSLHEIPHIKLPEIGIVAQTYIGNKVRQAELLREWMKLVERTANKLFTAITDELGYVKREPEKTSWATLENRLDPVYYDKQYSFFYDDWFINNSNPLNDYILEGNYGVLPASNSYGTGSCRFVTAADIIESNYDSRNFKNVPIEEVHKKAKISKGQILLEIKGGINYCVVASETLDGAYVNGSVFRFTVKDIDADYLAYYLNSKFKNVYCDRVSVNNIIKYLDQESIHALPVLRLGVDIENKLAHSYRTVQILTREVFNLTQSSKFLIESLIEGQITENQLIEAQQALDDGDNSKDRAILSKLTDKGYLAEGGNTLFDDLDKLYELLVQAKAAMDEDGELV
jgi:type I restriction enzyme S subunit